MKHFLFFLGLLFCHMQAYSYKQIEKNDTISIVSKNYLDVIENSDSIVWYMLDPMSEDTIALRLNGKEEILLCTTDTLTDRCNALKNALTYPYSFVANEMVKESTFLPDIAIAFYTKDNTTVFSYSFYCDLCRFEKDGKFQEVDGELIRNSIIQIACEVFPHDRYLRQLKRKNK